MNKRIRFVILCACIFSFSSLVLAQLDPEIASAKTFWEEFLRKAKVTKSENIGEGITKPKRLYLKRGDTEASAAWKSPAGLGAEKYDRWQWEIAAYRLDKMLGLNMVPPTVERRFRGRKGSCQFWVKRSLKANPL